MRLHVPLVQDYAGLTVRAVVPEAKTSFSVFVFVSLLSLCVPADS